MRSRLRFWVTMVLMFSLLLVSYSSRASAQVSQALVIDADYAGANQADDGVPDEFVAQLNGDQLEITLNGTVIFNDLAVNVTSLEVIGSSDDDTLTIVETIDGLPMFAGDLALDGGVSGTAHTNDALLTSSFASNIGMHFDGDGGVNTLQLELSSSAPSAYFADELAAAKSGVVCAGEGLSISFANLTPLNYVGNGGALVLSGASVTGLTRLTLSDTGTATDGVNIVTGDAGWEEVTFSGFPQLIVYLGNGSQTFRILSVDASPGATTIGPDIPLALLTIYGDDGSLDDTSTDTFVVRTLPAAITAQLYGADDSDTFNIGDSASSLSNIYGSVVIDGGGHNEMDMTYLTIGDRTNSVETGDILNLNDQGTAGAFAYALNATEFSRAGAGPVTFNAVETINMNTCIGSAYVIINTTAREINVNVTTQDAVDDIEVIDTGRDSSVTISSSAGEDTIEITSTGIDGGGGDIFGMGSFTLVAAGLDDDTITLAGAGADSRVKLNGNAGYDTVNVQACAATSWVYANGGDDTDSMQVGSATNSLAGIQGHVFINGNAHGTGTGLVGLLTVSKILEIGDTLQINDNGDAGSYTYTITDTYVSRTGISNINYDTIETLIVNTSIGTADVDVLTTLEERWAKIYTQDAADDIDVTTTGTDSIVEIFSGDGADDINVADTGGDGTDADDYGGITIVDGKAGNDLINVTYTGNILVQGGDGNDVIDKEGPAPAIPAEAIFGGNLGTDVVNVNGPLTTHGLGLYFEAETVNVYDVLGPVNGGPLQVTNSGHIIFRTGSTYMPALSGTTDGGTHDLMQLIYFGDMMTIEPGVTLSLDTSAYTHTSGSIMLVDNDETDAVTGTFAGLAEGAETNPGGTPNFMISYVGGDGNDVTLTAVGPAAVLLAGIEGVSPGWTLLVLGAVTAAAVVVVRRR